MSRALRTLLLIALGGLGVMLPHTAAIAGQSINPLTLNPVPPSFETCMAVGKGAICQGFRDLGPYAQDAGIACGTDAHSVELFDSGTLHTQSAIRYYDQNLNLTRRVIHETWAGQWSNPVTGAVAPYKQHTIATDILAVPGDLGSVTETVTGSIVFTLPHDGALAVDAGRVTTAPDGSIEFASGRHDILEFVLGDAGALQKLCTALGAP